MLHTRKAEHLGEELEIALLDGSVVLGQVVVPVAYSESALSEIEYVHVRIGQVGIHERAEEHALTAVVHLRYEPCQLLLVGNGIYRFDIFPEGSRAFLVEPD